MLFAPEFLIFFIAKKLFGTRYNSEKLKKQAYSDGVPWSLTHTMLVDMGGIAICFPGSRRSSREETLEETKSRPFIKDPNSPHFRTALPAFIKDYVKVQKRWFGGCTIPWEPYEAHFENATKTLRALKNEKEELLTWEVENIATLSGSVWILDAKQLLIARKYGIIKKMPKINKAEIDDKSKSNTLVKFLAIIQVLWLVVQLIARKINSLPSIPLEISTVAFSVSAFILYIIEWDKPKEVYVPFYIDADVSSVSLEAFKAINNAAPFVYPRTQIMLLYRNYFIPTCTFHEIYGEKVEAELKLKESDSALKEAENQLKKADIRTFLIAIVTILTFGGIHLLAWDAEFPNPVEQLLWKICAIINIAISLVYTACHAFFMGKSPKSLKRSTVWKLTIAMTAAGAVYILARVYLIVESFRSLYYLHPRAFISTWTDNMPYVA
ncbi:hypothetical protein PT974_09764 [Cladobotryum mycophilum]|uniref:Uncharacterized protein n=1 Tax=Cladobotryum mycophilum TaxID=491253 RepID=A0ABR0SH69_9HYPO